MKARQKWAKAVTGGEPAEFQGPARGRVLPGDPKEGGLLGCERVRQLGPERSAERGSGQFERDPRDEKGRWHVVARGKTKDVLAVALLVKKGARDTIHKAPKCNEARAFGKT